MSSDRQGIKFYYEWQDQILMLPIEDQLNVIKAIFKYDRYGERTEFNNIYLNMAMEKFYVDIDLQQERWEARTKQPARYPLEIFIPFFEQGLSTIEIAKKIGCTDRTVRNKKKEYESKVNKSKLNKSFPISVSGNFPEISVLSDLVGQDKELKNFAEFEYQTRIEKGMAREAAIEEVKRLIKIEQSCFRENFPENFKK